jgi:pilus assembly protein Flp/PilA
LRRVFRFVTRDVSRNLIHRLRNERDAMPLRAARSTWPQPAALCANSRHVSQLAVVRARNDRMRGTTVAQCPCVARSTSASVTAFRTLGVARRHDAREERVMALVNYFRSFAKDESGQDLLEYALLVALIALVAFGAIQLAGSSVNTIFTNIATKLSAAS